MLAWAAVAGLGSLVLAAGCTWSALSTRSWQFELAEGETIHLPQVDAELTVNDLAVDLYETTNRPRQYSVGLAFTSTDTVRLRSEVNSPARFRGHHFYLRSYRQHGGTALVAIVLRRNPAWPVILAGFAVLCLGVLGFSVALLVRGRREDRRRATRLERGLRITALVFFVVGLVLLVRRAVATGHLPFANMYESLLFFGTATLAFLAFTRDTGIAGLAVAVTLGVSLFLLPERLAAPRPLLPALNSPWFGPHVALAFLGYGGLLAAVLSPRRDAALPIAFACFTLSVALGSVWAERAWASFWSWDPKETWSLVTWLLMAGAVAVRPFGHHRVERTLAALALATVLYNFVVVNVVLRGLHSY